MNLTKRIESYVNPETGVEITSKNLTKRIESNDVIPLSAYDPYDHGNLTKRIERRIVEPTDAVNHDHAESHKEN